MTRACGTFVAVEAGQVYGPADIPAGPTPIPFTPLAQTAVSGTGSEADPLTIVTLVALGNSGLRVSQTDSYVVGRETFQTDVEVINEAALSVDVVVYRAGDCYLDDSDMGLGEMEGASVNCKALPDSADPERIVQFVPISAGSRRYEALYSEVWTKVMTGLPFPDTCRCADPIYNGLGLSWSRTVAAGQTKAVSHITGFSPIGTKPLEVTKTADDSTVDTGAADGYTITITNRSTVDATLTSITDTLPAGFAYTTGSSTGPYHRQPDRERPAAQVVRHVRDPGHRRPRLGHVALLGDRIHDTGHVPQQRLGDGRRGQVCGPSTSRRSGLRGQGGWCAHDRLREPAGATDRWPSRGRRRPTTAEPRSTATWSRRT